MRLGTNHVSSWVYVIGQVGAGIVMVLVTPWKINMEPKNLRFGSDDFPDFNWVIFRFDVMFIGVVSSSTLCFGEQIW